MLVHSNQVHCKLRFFIDKIYIFTGKSIQIQGYCETSDFWQIYDKRVCCIVQGPSNLWNSEIQFFYRLFIIDELVYCCLPDSFKFSLWYLHKHMYITWRYVTVDIKIRFLDRFNPDCYIPRIHSILYSSFPLNITCSIGITLKEYPHYCSCWSLSICYTKTYIYTFLILIIHNQSLFETG